MCSDIRCSPRIESNEVEICSKTKYLGVQIDESLTGKSTSMTFQLKSHVHGLLNIQGIFFNSRLFGLLTIAL